MGRCRAGGDFIGDVLACAEAGINQIMACQMVYRFGVEGQSVRLEDRFSVPAHAKPGQILQYSRDMFLATAPRIDVIYSQKDSPALRARQIPGHQCGPAMSHVQTAGRTGGKACHNMLWAVSTYHTHS